MDIQLKIDDREILMNKFAQDIFSSVIAGAISELQEKKEKAEKKQKIGDNWQKIEIEITR